MHSRDDVLSKVADLGTFPECCQTFRGIPVHEHFTAKTKGKYEWKFQLMPSRSTVNKWAESAPKQKKKHPTKTLQITKVGGTKG